jgi:hypothetical protein
MSREIDAAIAEAREAFQRLRGRGAPSPLAAPGAPVSATAGVPAATRPPSPPAPMPAPPAPARPPERYLANAADREAYAYCGTDGVLPGSGAGLGYGGYWGPV